MGGRYVDEVENSRLGAAASAGVGQDGHSAGVGRGEGRGAQPRRREGGEGDHIDPGWGAWRRHGGYNAGYVELSGGVRVF